MQLQPVRCWKEVTMNPKHKKILGVDYGDVRTGLAVNCCCSRALPAS